MKPEQPGLYQDATGGLWAIHFDDGETRLLADPVVAGHSIPLDELARVTELSPVGDA